MKKKDINVIIWQTIIIIASAGLFYWSNNLNKNQIKFLLDFYKGVPEIFFGHWLWYNEAENCYRGSYYIISEKCLGLNITVLIFGLCGAMNIGKFKSYKKLLWLLISGALAVVLGVFANMLRLLSSIYFTSYAKFEVLHAILGIVIYLSIMIFCYMFSKKVIKDERGGGVDEEHI